MSAGTEIFDAVVEDLLSMDEVPSHCSVEILSNLYRNLKGEYDDTIRYTEYLHEPVVKEALILSDAEFDWESFFKEEQL